MTVLAIAGWFLPGVPTARGASFFQDAFDPPLPGWTTGGAWHLATEGSDPCYGDPVANHPPAAASPTGAMAYHYDASPPARPGQACTYDLDGGGFSAANAGNLTTPAFDLTASGPAVWLHFATWREVEPGAFFDYMNVTLDYGSGPVQVLQLSEPPSPQTTWETVDVDISAAAGSPSVTLTFRFDTVDGVLNGFAGWYIDDVLVDDVVPSIDTLTFAPNDAAPPEALPGTANVLMAWLDLSVDANSATVDQIQLDLTGSPPADADVSLACIWLDDGDGSPGPGDAVVGCGGFSGATTTIPLFTTVAVTAGAPETLWVTFDIAASATVGNYVGVGIVNSGYVTALPPDVVACSGCPLDTYDGTKTRIGAPTSDNVTVTPVDLAPATVVAGSSGVLMGALDFDVDANTATVGDITLNLTGSPPSTSDVGLVWLRQDDGDGVYNTTTDPAIDAQPFSGLSVTLTANLSLAAGAPERVWIALDITPGATDGNYVGLRLESNTSVSVSAPDDVVCPSCPFDTYVPGGKTRITSPTTFDLTLPAPGWYLLSFPVEVADTDVNAILSSLAGSFAIVRAYDASSPVDPWKAHTPGRGGDLADLDNSVGFWILVTAPSLLSVAGVFPSSPTTVPLKAGWNLVGFPSVNATYSVQDLKAATGATRVEGFDASGPYHLQPLGDTRALTAGEGYWVFVPAPVDWVVPPT